MQPDETINPSDAVPPQAPTPAGDAGGIELPVHKKPGLGWGVAIALVILVWAGAVVMRGGGGEKVELLGWEAGLEAGQAKAAEFDRPMVVMFTADWCRPCQILKREILTEPGVEEVLFTDFVPVTVDMTNAGRSDPRISEYRIDGYPTLIVLSPDGEEIQRVSGFGRGAVASTEAFQAWLESAND